MSKNTKLFLLTLFVIVSVSLMVTWKDIGNIFIGKTKGNYKPGVSAQFDEAVGQAKVLYKQKKSLGVDFTDGPCLTNDLLPGWVVDIVHNPRQKIDDAVVNQCQAYLEGRAEHFIELDTEGNVVKVK